VLKFYNADGSAATAANTNDGFTPGDILVLSVLSGTTIQINDVVLTGPNAFKKVGSAIEGLNNGLVAFETSTGATTACDDAADKYALQNGDVHRIAVFDGSSDGRYGVGDTVYVPITALCVGGTAEPAAGNSPNVNDVRLTKLGTGSAGTVLVSGDVDVFYNLPASALAKALCAIDADGVSGVSSGDPVYMTTGAASCPTTLPVGAVRLNTIGTIYGSTYTAGTIVGGADQDFSRTLITFDDGTATFCYYNADGSTGYSMNDIVYASRTTCSATVTINDVVLSGPNAYKKVAGVAEGQNNALASSGFAAEVAFFDASGDNSAGLGDTFYLRTTSGATSPNILDIRLTPLNVCDTCVNITPTPTPTGTTVPPTSGGTTPPTSGGTVPPTSDGSSSASPTTGGKKQPGFELVALVAALGAALVLVRRKL
ncbi:MAG TPA: hypothetical protein VI796_05280, partial [Candidatus Thermoplasmatota archaeon]|nr:hypothetical protein [Candidatus Thermoplasmatota archaeon]